MATIRIEPGDMIHFHYATLGIGELVGLDVRSSKPQLHTCDICDYVDKTKPKTAVKMRSGIIRCICCQRKADKVGEL